MEVIVYIAPSVLFLLGFLLSKKRAEEESVGERIFSWFITSYSAAASSLAVLIIMCRGGYSLLGLSSIFNLVSFWLAGRHARLVRKGRLVISMLGAGLGHVGYALMAIIPLGFL